MMINHFITTSFSIFSVKSESLPIRHYTAREVPQHKTLFLRDIESGNADIKGYFALDRRKCVPGIRTAHEINGQEEVKVAF